MGRSPDRSVIARQAKEAVGKTFAPMLLAIGNMGMDFSGHAFSKMESFNNSF
jgi:hypothetical protein